MTRQNWDGRLPPYRPEQTQRYLAAGVWQRQTIAQQFESVAARVPAADAVVSADGRLSYAELSRESDLLAAALHESGLDIGDPVLFQLNNRVSTVVAWYATLKAGLVPVATLAMHRMHEISEISRRTRAVAHLVDATPGGSFDLVDLALTHAGTSTTVTHVLTVGSPHQVASTTRIEDLATAVASDVARKVVHEIQAQIDPDDVAVFQLSGGTTNVPKVIPRRHAEYWYNASAYADYLGWEPDVRVAHLGPVLHNAGVVCGIHAAHSVGGCLILGTPGATSTPLLVAEGVTDMIVGQFQFSGIAERGVGHLAGSLRRAVLSGAKVPAPVFDAIETAGIWSGQLFGMGEGFFAVTALDSSREIRSNTVGTPMTELDEFKILEPGSDQELPDGTTGELCCRGPYTIPGYLDAAEHNASAFTVDGFYRTGDLATVINLDGVRCLSINGRIKDLINRGGEKINAEEVELLLLKHPDIREVAVVGMPDARMGERTCAYVASTAGVDIDAVRAHLDALGVAKFKWPERVEQVDGLPRSNVEKVNKKLLRVWAADAVRAGH